MKETGTESDRLRAETPPALRAALAASASAAAAWEGLTPIGRRDFVTWIEQAKQEATRLKRVAVCIDKLERGERRPCCYNVVPLDVHNALKAVPDAKVRWTGLSPDEKRNWIDWVEAAPDKAARKERLEKMCVMLAAGKSAPLVK